MMQSYGCSSVSEYLGDRIVYRNLEAQDPRLPPLADLRQEAGLDSEPIPRKGELPYAQVVACLLRRARALDAPGVSLRRLIYVGDTRMSDAGAFASICLAGGWAGQAFIGAETSAPPSFELFPAPGLPPGYSLFLANRWSALDDFACRLAESGFVVNEQTAVVIDLDKTALGARGRNAQVIDAARVQAVHETVADLLGTLFDPQAFLTAYERLNQPEFHPFTADNQDYLAYVCLMLGSGLFQLEWLVKAVRSGRLTTFPQFLQLVEARRADLPGGLAEIHAEIYALSLAGDPTPFKAFRRNEYRITVSRMGCLPDTASPQEMLTNEIVLTQEVRQIARQWQAQGALLFGLSDKPDEASIPTAELAAQGFVPLHRKETHVVGE